MRKYGEVLMGNSGNQERTTMQKRMIVFRESSGAIRAANYSDFSVPDFLSSPLLCCLHHYTDNLTLVRAFTPIALSTPFPL
jgi:hypothetical protein